MENNENNEEIGLLDSKKDNRNCKESVRRWSKCGRMGGVTGG